MRIDCLWRFFFASSFIRFMRSNLCRRANSLRHAPIHLFDCRQDRRKAAPVFQLLRFFITQMTCAERQRMKGLCTTPLSSWLMLISFFLLLSPPVFPVRLSTFSLASDASTSIAWLKRRPLFTAGDTQMLSQKRRKILFWPSKRCQLTPSPLLFFSRRWKYSHTNHLP